MSFEQQESSAHGIYCKDIALYLGFTSEVNNIVNWQGFFGIQATNDIFVTGHHLQDAFWLEANVCVNKHKVCGTLVGHHFRHQVVTGSSDQALIDHGV